MTFSSVLLKTATVVALSPQPDQGGFTCGLRWRRKQLWVRKRHQGMVLPALNNERWLQACLQHSTIKRVWLDRRLEAETILTWAKAGKQVNKEVWMRLPASVRPCPSHLFRESLDWLSALVLLLLLSPGLLLLILLLKVTLKEGVFQKEWCVNTRGRLFERVRLTTVGTRLGQGLQRLHLHRLPQLWNVVKGDMKLMGVRPWTLEETLRFG